VGQEFSTGIALGGNAKCINMLLAFKQVVKDYTPQPMTMLRNDLGQIVKRCEEFL
jgi:hypothetical protein